MATVNMTAQNLDSYVDKEGIVLLDFWAAWCGPCRAFAPVFEAASDAHPDVVFGKIDTEAETELSQSFQIRAIPTLMVFRDGIIVFSHSGALPVEALDEIVTQVKQLDMEEVKKKVAEAEANEPSPEDFENDN
jgi:thioredoxin 1